MNALTLPVRRPAGAATTESPAQTETRAVTVYWRPGCPFSAALARELERAGVSARWIDIWQDPGAAAFVRSVANGDETVPTVVVDSQVMVNPRVDDVQASLREAASGAPFSTAGS